MPDREETLDALVGRLLMVGAATGLLLMAAGLGLALAGQPSTGVGVLDPRAVFWGAVAGNPTDLMKMGILILMATPVIRVVALVPGFLWAGKPRFALVSLLVLGLLAISFVFAAGA
jgi:uncharacterized membrane protein